MHLFNVAPFDQHLRTSSGADLDGFDSSKTFSELKILPRTLIYLRADEPQTNGSNGDVNGLKNGRAADRDDVWANAHPEEGFKGERIGREDFLLRE